MDAYWLDWANLLLRWVHVIVAIAWIGSSFYFVFLDNNLIKPQSPDLLEKGVDGAMWAVHGGGFYNPQKYMVAPKKIHTKLHWFYWESYTTWITGFALFALLYLFNARTYLIDPKLMDWTPGAAIGVAISFLVVFWMAYDLICQAFGFKQFGKVSGEVIVGVLVLAVVCFMSWLACQWFSGRAAFLIVGASIATAMSANVFFWIIPGQKKVVEAMTSGKPYDAKALSIHGKRGKQRSVHNTYFTLPVIFAMLSNHYSFLYTHDQRWVILVLMMLAGALIRQFFVQRHAFHHGRAKHPWPFAAAGLVLIAATAAWLKPEPITINSVAINTENTKTEGMNDSKNSAQSIQTILEARCIQCHGAQVQMKNVRLDSDAELKKHAQAVYQQVVVTRQMPMNNSTNITEPERAAIKAWFEAGVK